MFERPADHVIAFDWLQLKKLPGALTTVMWALWCIANVPHDPLLTTLPLYRDASQRRVGASKQVAGNVHAFNLNALLYRLSFGTNC